MISLFLRKMLEKLEYLSRSLASAAPVSVAWCLFDGYVGFVATAGRYQHRLGGRCRQNSGSELLARDDQLLHWQWISDWRQT
jgi:hypothetical protein